MLSSVAACVVFLVSPLPRLDTLGIIALRDTPRLDGRIERNEYGTAAIYLASDAGGVDIWLGRSQGWIYLAAFLHDTTFYWGDDLVVSLDPDGSGGTRPGAGDRQWYLRRVLDSSQVVVSPGGRWTPAGQEAPALGAVRTDPDWEVATTSSRTAWIVELKIREGAFQAGRGPPRLSVRTYNDRPRGWWSWPAPPPGTPAQRVEQTPDLWVPVLPR